jgi:preprotein translocase subunit SecE
MRLPVGRVLTAFFRPRSAESLVFDVLYSSQKASPRRHPNLMNSRAEDRGSGLDTRQAGNRRAFCWWAVFSLYYFFEEFSVLLRVVASSGDQRWRGRGRLADRARASALAVCVRCADGGPEGRLAITAGNPPDHAGRDRVMVLIVGIILWLFDMVLMAILKALTGQGRLSNVEALVCRPCLFGLRGAGDEIVAGSVSSAQGWKISSGQILVPTEEVVEMRGGQQRKSERKFFPWLRPRPDGD